MWKAILEGPYCGAHTLKGYTRETIVKPIRWKAILESPYCEAHKMDSLLWNPTMKFNIMNTARTALRQQFELLSIQRIFRGIKSLTLDLSDLSDRSLSDSHGQ